MSSSLNGYALANNFRKVRHRNKLTSLDADLFYELVAVCNDEGWPPVFQLSNARLHGAVGCTEKGLIECRKRLAAAGLLAFVAGTNRNPTHYSLTLSQGLLEVRVSGEKPAAKPLPETLPQVSIPASDSAEKDDKPLPEHLPKHLPECLLEVSPLYKEQTKRKTKTLAPAPAVGVSEALSFDAFWQAYGKKQDRHKSARRWEALSDADRQAALDALPAYVTATPDRKYRKNPLTWLSGRCWLDEEMPTVGGGVAPAATSRPTLPADFNPSNLFRPALSLAESSSPALRTAAA